MNRSERAQFGPIIRAERARLGMTQTELAEAADTTQRTIGSIERGDRVAQPALLLRILNALGLSPEGKGQGPDSDIETLVAVVSPFLASMDEEHRAEVMPKLIEVLVREMRAQIAAEFRDKKDNEM